jgi:hypothetical protein
MFIRGSLPGFLAMHDVEKRLLDLGVTDMTVLARPEIGFMFRAPPYAIQNASRICRAILQQLLDENRKP